MSVLLLNLVIASLIIMAGSILQASTGLGVIVPLLALIDLNYIPGPVIFGSIALSLLMTIQGRHHIDTTKLHWLVSGLVVGIFIGVAVLNHIPMQLVGMLFGVLIIVAVVLSYFKFRIHFNMTGLLMAGLVSGIMGTIAAIGAPVLALLYQYHDVRTIRATLGFLYFLSSILMIGVLHVYYQFGVNEIKQGFMLMPGFILGFILAQPIAKRLNEQFTRPIVLIICFFSALFLVVKSMTSYIV